LHPVSDEECVFTNHEFCVVRPARQLGIQARGFGQVPKMSRGAATELSSGVALPPPDDEFVSGSGNEVPEQMGETGATLSGRYDSYEGVIVDPGSLPSDGSTFQKSLMASIAQWKREVPSRDSLFFQVCILSRHCKRLVNSCDSRRAAGE
jgi:hypothetical protein